jgi:hypothetical protein
MKNSNDTMGNRTRDLPVCSELPQPNVPPRFPLLRGTFNFFILNTHCGKHSWQYFGILEAAAAVYKLYRVIRN